MRQIVFVLLMMLLGIRGGSADERTLELVSLTFPPYVFEKNGEITGVASEIIREVARRNGLAVRITILPWARSLAEVKRGNADGIFTIYKTPERMKFLTYADEVLIGQDVSFFVRQEASLSSLEDLMAQKKLTIGVRRAVNYGSLFSELQNTRSWKQVSLGNSDAGLLQQLISGRVDVIPMNRNVAYFHIEQMGVFGRVRELSPPIQHVDSYIAFSKERFAMSLSTQFSQTLREMKDDGSYREIVGRWFVD